MLPVLLCKWLFSSVMLTKPTAELFLPITDELPQALLPWITYQDSLTERLKATAGEARLDVLAQRWVLPNWWDTHVLQIDSETVLHREILIWAHHKPCWYARTVIPYTTYHTDAAFFNRLEKESLGELIFNQVRVKRVYQINYPINDQSIEYHWLTEAMHYQTKTLWVRLSTFVIDDDRPFFLIETLLPGLMRYPN